jgi:cell division protein FtsA
MTRAPELIVGLDIGSSRVAVVVAELGEAGPAVIGAATASCDGVRRGVVVNIDATAQGIEEALKEAERAAGVEIHSVFADVGGDHIRGLNSHGVVPVRDGEVSEGDVDRVLETARTIAFPADVEILHVLPQEYIVDGVGGIRSPIGMSGVRLEARVHVITTLAQHARNVVRCCERVGLHVADLVLAPLAAAEAVLDPEEKDAGVAVLDIGAGTTDVLVFGAGALRHTAILPFGGHHVSSDVAAGLRTPFRDAEALKQRHGSVLHGVPGASDPSVEVPTAGARGTRLVSRQKLAHVIEARMEEILTLAQGQVARSGLLEDLGCGVVITGGTALLPGLVPLAERIFQCPVRIGVAGERVETASSGDRVAGAPSFAAAVGLVLYGVRPLDPFFDLRSDRERGAGRAWAQTLQRWWKSISRG